MGLYPYTLNCSLIVGLFSLSPDVAHPACIDVMGSCHGIAISLLHNLQPNRRDDVELLGKYLGHIIAMRVPLKKVNDAFTIHTQIGGYFPSHLLGSHSPMWCH